MTVIENWISATEFATLFAASAFFAWVPESWKDSVKIVFLTLTAFAVKVTVNEVTFERFSLETLQQWTPLTWGTLGFFLGAVIGALARTVKPHSGK